MSEVNFNEQEIKLLVQTLDAAISNVFFDDELFVTLCGFKKDELIEIKRKL